MIDYVGAPNVEDIAPASELMNKNVWLSGKVLDKNCNPLKNVIVHCWYAGGDPGNLIYHYKYCRKYNIL